MSNLVFGFCPPIVFFDERVRYEARLRRFDNIDTIVRFQEIAATTRKAYRRNTASGNRLALECFRLPRVFPFPVASQPEASS